jgi:hypothetical protein
MYSLLALQSPIKQGLCDQPFQLADGECLPRPRLSEGKKSSYIPFPGVRKKQLDDVFVDFLCSTVGAEDLA